LSTTAAQRRYSTRFLSQRATQVLYDILCL